MILSPGYSFFSVQLYTLMPYMPYKAHAAPYALRSPRPSLSPYRVLVSRTRLLHEPRRERAQTWAQVRRGLVISDT